MIPVSQGAPDPGAPISPGRISWRDRAHAVIAGGVVLALLYVGRTVLIPLVVAAMLSLLLAPLVRLLRRGGIGQVLSVLVAALTFVLAVATIATTLGTQVLRLASGLPQYEQTLQQKLRQLDQATLGRLDTLTSAAGRLMDHQAEASGPGALSGSSASMVQAIPVAVQTPRTSPFQLLEKILASIWGPVEATGIVLVVLVFILLDHEVLRDRLIRLAGSHIRLTTLALNDAGARLSRFFVSQFAVNACVGVAIGLGLRLAGVPHATLWGTLAATLRFVPYVGIWIAGFFATSLAFVLVPGWSLALETFGLFVLVELIAGQLVEPNLYGHATGLSPLSVIVAAIFWSALWGPVGLILSTPLTLCLVVVGRHVKALEFFDVLLGDTQALSLPQKFYQRALSGDSDEILVNARTFLKQGSLADYCDRVLMPALQLALLDYEIGAISADRQTKIREVIVEVISKLDGGAPRRLLRRISRDAVLDHLGPGRALRHHREQREGKWQGPLAVAPGSITVCLSLGPPADDLAAELLARVLRDKKLDARSFSVLELDIDLPSEATPGAVALVYLVSAFPTPERERSAATAESVRHKLPQAEVVNVFLPGLLIDEDTPIHRKLSGRTVTSFSHALKMSLDR